MKAAVQQNSPGIEFWAAQILWFGIMFIIAIAVTLYWWQWGTKWIDAGGTSVVPIVALIAIAVELGAIVYFKTSVPEDENKNN
ncbi:MAG: hypothetical protein IJ849_11590 [Selenomonadaceae bacterium]|nr:hypothetical protein [Selenomonadaceae bacterium]